VAPEDPSQAKEQHAHGIPPKLAGPDAERRFQSLIEDIPGIVVYLDLVQPDDPGCSLPLYISPQIEEMLGYPREAWLTDDELWLQVLHPDDAERMTAADAEARRTLSSLFAEYRMIARDGHVVWVSEKAAVVEDEPSGRVYWQGMMVDITERRHAEEALAANERQYRSIFEAAAIGVMTLGLDGRILEANPTLERICEYPAGTLVGRALHDFLDPDDAASPEQFAELAAGARERCELEHRFRRRDRSWMWCRTVMTLIRDGADRPAHITAMLEDISDRKLVEADLVHRTLHDPLTGLPNRQLFLDQLEQARTRRFAASTGIAVVFIDMDGFKQVNDSFGHHAGDELLVAVAGRLLRAVRPGDSVARFGGDEFVVLADEVESLTDATQLAWRLTSSLRAPFSVAGQTVRVTASLGVAYSADPADLANDILRKADAAMYLAKDRGCNRVAVYGNADDKNAAA
jgi:diguanylate cyclase (GGDEF)-like protein/PAS domain S-box-containing protein